MEATELHRSHAAQALLRSFLLRTRARPIHPAVRGPGGSDSGSGPVDTGGQDVGFQNTGEARAPRRDYDGIPAVEAPGAGISVPEDLRYAQSSGIPGDPLTPSYGSLGAEDSGNSAHGSDLRNVGEADALASQGQRQAVQLPMLLAVVALATVTAGLVRTWVLRRAS